MSRKSKVWRVWTEEEGSFSEGRCYDAYMPQEAAEIRSRATYFSPGKHVLFVQETLQTGRNLVDPTGSVYVFQALVTPIKVTDISAQFGGFVPGEL